MHETAPNTLRSGRTQDKQFRHIGAMRLIRRHRGHNLNRTDKFIVRKRRQQNTIAASNAFDNLFEKSFRLWA